jgi:hypothetical protein
MFSAIVEKPLHVLDCRRESLWLHGCRIAIEGDHIVTARALIAEDEHFPPAFVSKSKKRVSGTAQEAGEIEIPRLESCL